MADLPDWAIDNPEIVGDIRLLRRIPEFLVHDGVIESSCFDEREAGRGLSVTAWLSAADLDDIRRFNENFGVVCVSASVFRAFGVTIVPVPLVGNINHHEIFPRLNQRARKALKGATRWVHYPEWVLPVHRGPTETF